METIKDFFEKLRALLTIPSHTRTLALFGVLFLVIVLPITVIFLGQQTNFFQHAYLAPPGGGGGNPTPCPTWTHSSCNGTTLTIVQQLSSCRQNVSVQTDSTTCGWKPPVGPTPTPLLLTCKQAGYYCYPNPIPSGVPVLSSTLYGGCPSGNSCISLSPNCATNNHFFTDAFGNTKTTDDSSCEANQCNSGEAKISGTCPNAALEVCCVPVHEYNPTANATTYTCVDPNNPDDTAIQGSDGSVTFCNGTSTSPQICSTTNYNVITNGKESSYQVNNGKSAQAALCTTAPTSNIQYTCMSSGTQFSGPGNDIIACNSGTTCVAGKTYTETGTTAQAKQNICLTYSKNHPFPGDQCENSAGQVGVCLYEAGYNQTNSWWQTDKAGTIIYGGVCPVTNPGVGTSTYCQNVALPDCASAIPGTVGGSDSKEWCSAGPLDAFKCCIYNNQTATPNPTAPVPGTTITPTSSSSPTPGGSGNPGGGGNPGPGGPGGGGSCTAGQDTQIAINLQLDGIGLLSGENNTPAHTTRTALSITVTDGSGNGVPVPNNTNTVFTYAPSSGTFNSSSIDLGTSLNCNSSYTVTVKIPQYVAASTALSYGKSQTLNLSPFAGDISPIANNGVIIGDNKIDINDYNLFRACYQNISPTAAIPVIFNTSTINIQCGNIINLLDYADGGTQGDEWSYNYNTWVRGYIKANGY